MVCRSQLTQELDEILEDGYRVIVVNGKMKELDMDNVVLLDHVSRQWG